MAKSGQLIVFTLDSPEVKALCSSDERLSVIIRRCGTLTYKLHTDDFTFMVETVIRQLLSNRAANSIVSRLYSLCNGRISVESILGLDKETLRGIGLSNRKTDYILRLAETVHGDPELFLRLKEMPDREVIRKLMSLYGIGPWSAKMYLIFVLDRQDVLPYEDGAFIQVYKWMYETEDIETEAIERQCAPWRPYTSLAARYLYRVLDEGLLRNADILKELNNASSTRRPS